MLPEEGDSVETMDIHQKKALKPSEIEIHPTMIDAMQQSGATCRRLYATAKTSPLSLSTREGISPKIDPPVRRAKEAIAACRENLGLDLWLEHWHPSHLLLNSLTPLDAHPLRSPQNPIL